MIAVAEREESLEQFFEYELTSEQMSIFKEGMMRKPDKPSLRKVLLPESESLTLVRMTYNQSQSVILFDGYEDESTTHHEHLR